MLRKSKSPKVAPVEETSSPEAIEFKGVVYQPTHHAYHRIKEQIEQNDYHRAEV